MDCYVEVLRGRVVESLHTVSVGVSHGPVGGAGGDCEVVPEPVEAGRLLPVIFGR